MGFIYADIKTDVNLYRVLQLIKGCILYLQYKPVLISHKVSVYVPFLDYITHLDQHRPTPECRNRVAPDASAIFFHEFLQGKKEKTNMPALLPVAWSFSNAHVFSQGEQIRESI